MVFAYLMNNHFYKNDTFDCGMYNGYVGITPNENKLPDSWMSGGSFDIENPLNNSIQVHGGITFDRVWTEEWYPKEKVIQYPLTDVPEDVIGSRVIGFDTSHINSDSSMDYEWCKSETLYLRDQILWLLGKDIN